MILSLIWQVISPPSPDTACPRWSNAPSLFHLQLSAALGNKQAVTKLPAAMETNDRSDPLHNIEGDEESPSVLAGSRQAFNLFWLCLIFCYNGGTAGDQHIVSCTRIWLRWGVLKTLENSKLTKQRISVFLSAWGHVKSWHYASFPPPPHPQASAPTCPNTRAEKRPDKLAEELKVQESSCRWFPWHAVLSRHSTLGALEKHRPLGDGRGLHLLPPGAIPDPQKIFFSD